MRKLAAQVLLLFLVAMRATMAQTEASIHGTVRDSLSRPMPNADVTIMPGGRRVRTDSAGRFAFESLGAGQYVVRARRVGYSPTDWTVQVSGNGRADIQLVLADRMTSLDTVFVTDGRPCEPQKYEGFLCRRASARGTFLDYTDIDSMNVLYSAELLRDVGGFYVDVMPTNKGPTRVAASRQCTIVLMDGIPWPWSGIPEYPDEILGVEIYKSPKDIPKEYRRYTWGKERCWLVAYWTYNKLKPVRKVALPRP